METEEEVNLVRLLDCYWVADADRQLLERIVTRAEAAKAKAKHVPVHYAWIKGAAAIAATAVLGFWLGSASSLPLGHYTAAARTAAVPVSASTNINLDKVILGPQSFNEVML
jgi:hypothetical protein